MGSITVSLLSVLYCHCEEDPPSHYPRFMAFALMHEWGNGVPHSSRRRHDSFKLVPKYNTLSTRPQFWGGRQKSLSWVTTYLSSNKDLMLPFVVLKYAACLFHWDRGKRVLVLKQFPIQAKGNALLTVWPVSLWWRQPTKWHSSLVAHFLVTEVLLPWLLKWWTVKQYCVPKEQKNQTKNVFQIYFKSIMYYRLQFIFQSIGWTRVEILCILKAPEPLSHFYEFKENTHTQHTQREKNEWAKRLSFNLYASWLLSIQERGVRFPKKAKCAPQTTT